MTDMRNGLRRLSITFMMAAKNNLKDHMHSLHNQIRDYETPLTDQKGQKE